jgi:RNA polymerase sigma-70 factor (ECF subfamily)
MEKMNNTLRVSDYSVFSDLALIELAKSGTCEALGSLFGRHYQSMYRLSYSVCRNNHDAEEITQEAFMKASRSIAQFQAQSKFSTWLHRITVNTALDWIKKRAKKASLKKELAEELLRHKSSTCQELSVRLHEAIDELPAKLQQALQLTIFEGLSHKEASNILGCAETTVSWRIFQAKKKLRKKLASN